jgi:hypothetical protein
MSETAYTAQSADCLSLNRGLSEVRTLNSLPANFGPSDIRASKNDREKMLLFRSKQGVRTVWAIEADCPRPEERADVEREERNRAVAGARARGSRARHRRENTDARLWDLSDQIGEATYSCWSTAGSAPPAPLFPT